MIKTSHLKKAYGEKIAVNDMSFEVEHGKVTAFLGPNGAGKSTTMRLMLGLEKGEGTTTFGGKQLRDYKIPMHIVGYLLEAKVFHPTRSARNHLAIIATECNVPLTRVDQVLETVGLLNEASGKPSQFSLGMCQRLGIAAALLSEPKYLFLDEPANGLDPEGMAWLRGFLKSYARKGNTVFISSHLLAEVAQMADNVIVIGKGKLLVDSSVESFISGSVQASTFIRPADLAQFEKMLHKHKLSYKRNGKGLVVGGVTTDEIAKLAFNERLLLLELTNRSSSLEDAFIKTTDGFENYQSKVEEEL